MDSPSPSIKLELAHLEENTAGEDVILAADEVSSLNNVA